MMILATRITASASGAPEYRTENRHSGWAVAVNHRQDLLYCTPGAPETATFFRSAAKPFQAFPLVEAGYDALLTPEELAIACASHVASPAHLARVASILQKAGLDESALQCGPHAPLDPDTRESLRQNHQAPGCLHNNCSGKHAAMLFYCRQAGLDTAGYLDPAHPLQQRILSVLRHWGGVEEIPTGVDGCGAPVFYLPLPSMALLYAHLAVTPAFQPIRQAMITHPVLIGGDGRVDTTLMQASVGQLVAKVGADGVICVGNTQTGEGLALKIADGNNEIRNLAVVSLLGHLGWLDNQALRDPRLSPYLDHERRNTQGKVVGTYQFRWS